MAASSSAVEVACDRWGKLTEDILAFQVVALASFACRAVTEDRRLAAGSASVAVVGIGREGTVQVGTFQADLVEDIDQEGTDQEAFRMVAVSRGSQVAFL